MLGRKCLAPALAGPRRNARARFALVLRQIRKWSTTSYTPGQDRAGDLQRVGLRNCRKTNANLARAFLRGTASPGARQAFRRPEMPGTMQRFMNTPCGTRARNLRIRSPTPCPLGQEGPLHSMRRLGDLSVPLAPLCGELLACIRGAGDRLESPQDAVGFSLCMRGLYALNLNEV